jgi:hypothetical protein
MTGLEKSWERSAMFLLEHRGAKGGTAGFQMEELGSEKKVLEQLTAYLSQRSSWTFHLYDELPLLLKAVAE